MQRIIATSVAVLGIGMAMMLAPVRSAVGQAFTVPPDPPGNTHVVLSPPADGAPSRLRPSPETLKPSPGSPTLSEDERASAIAIIDADPLVQRLVTGNDTTVTRSYPLIAGDLEHNVGAGVTIALAHPLDTNETLPGIRGMGEGRPYLKLQLHAEWRNITSMTVLVDFEAQTVIAIRPDPDATAIELPGNLHFESNR